MARHNRTLPITSVSKQIQTGALSGGAVRYETPAYANAGGTGDRQSIITVTSNFVPDVTPVDWQKLVDGVNSNPTNMYWHNLADMAGKYFQFEFAASVIITEMKYYYTAGYFEGLVKATIQIKGSANGTDWTNVGAAAVPSLAGPSVISSISANATAYKYYQVFVVSGDLVGAEYEIPHEWEFKIGNPT